MIESGVVHDSTGLPLRLIRLKEVRQRTGLSTSTIYRWMKAGKFPYSHRIGGYIAAWSEADIDDWVKTAIHK